MRNFLVFSLCVGLTVESSGGAGQSKRLQIIDPVDNVKLLWADGQASRYRDAMQTSCSLAGASGRGKDEAECAEDTARSASWNKKQEEVYNYLERKYGTRNFTFDEESGLARPYFGPAR